MNELNLPHILVVDDDQSVRDVITGYLCENELRVTCAANGKEMLETLSVFAVDLVILDLRMPGEDGMQIARRLRDQSSIPIVVVSGKLEEADRIMALELGVDDYITKPFSSRELLARVRTVLRRSTAVKSLTHRTAEAGAYRFAGWELNRGSRRLTSHSGERVELTKGEFCLLSAFLASPDQVLPREELLESSRLYDGVCDRSIDVQILRLRRKIEQRPSTPQLIRTQRGAGYIFSCPVERFDALKS